LGSTFKPHQPFKTTWLDKQQTLYWLASFMKSTLAKTGASGQAQGLPLKKIWIERGK